MPFPYDPTVANRFLGYGELTRRGTTFGKLTDAVAAIATAIPTTTAAHTLWNGEPIGGKCYIIDSLTWYCITSTGAASSFGMLACLNPTVVTAQPAHQSDFHEREGLYGCCCHVAHGYGC